MPASLYLQNAWLNHTFGNSTMTQPTQWWVQLHYGDPGINCVANAWNAASRARVLTWSSASGKVNQNTAAATWSDLPNPSGILTQVTWISIWDATITTWPTVIGNPLTYSQLSVALTVAFHGTLTIPISSIVQTVI